VTRTPSGGYWINETDAAGFAITEVASAAIGGLLSGAVHVAGRINYNKQKDAWAAVMKAQTAEDWPLAYETAKRYAKRYPHEQAAFDALSYAAIHLELPLAESLELASLLEVHGVGKVEIALHRAMAYYVAEDMASLLRESSIVIGCDCPSEDKACGYMFRAQAMFWLGDLDQALADSNMAISLDPNATYYSRRAGVQWARGDLDKAIADYTLAMRLLPNEAELLDMRASVYEAQGDVVAAATDRRKADGLRIPKSTWPLGAPAASATTVSPATPQATSHTAAGMAPAHASPGGPTHVVPTQGMAFWSNPDGTQLPNGRLSPHLELMVVSASGAWALVRASNGWQGWVDGRLLVPRR
jgi:tetratricopeptide (TPR) repeat protein